MAKKLSDIHDTGEKHAAAGKYDPPVGPVQEALNLLPDGGPSAAEQNDAYRAGQANHKSQTK